MALLRMTVGRQIVIEFGLWLKLNFKLSWMIKHMAFPNASYMDQINISDTAISLCAEML